MATPIEDDGQREADAAALELAARVLQRRFGTLTAGDLIRGLQSCTGLLRSGTGIIKPERDGGGEKF